MNRNDVMLTGGSDGAWKSNQIKCYKQGSKFIFSQFKNAWHYFIFTKSIKMIIERTSKDVIFRLPSSTKLEDLQDIANLFAFKETAKK